MNAERRVYHISTFPPTQCGLATYTEDLIGHMREVVSVRIPVVENWIAGGGLQIVKGDLNSYTALARDVDAKNPCLVSLQHEFGIFGGIDGELILEFLARVKAPVITTLHTFSEKLSSHRVAILKELIARSAQLVFFSRRDMRLAIEHFGLPPTKGKVIRHGIPEVSLTREDLLPTVGGQVVFITIGHLKTTKGYTNALRLVSELRARGFKCRYLIVGQEQPHVEKYLGSFQMLMSQISELGLEGDVEVINKYLPLAQLISLVKRADVGLALYSRDTQNSSGTIPLMLGCGRYVISTRFPYTESIEGEIQGLTIIDNPESDQLADYVERLLSRREDLLELSWKNYLATRNWLWAISARKYRKVFKEF